jgi:trehalose 6-phosphate phosphatase
LTFPPLHHAALFFDVDGTLLDIAAKPSDVIADASLLDLLGELLIRTQGATALVSGRSIADIDRIFTPLRVTAAGLHGAEMRFPDGSARRAAVDVLDYARPGLVRFVADNPGLMLEDKGGAIAVHYRERPDLAMDVGKFVSGFASRDGVELQAGKFVVELKPVVHDKGTAIAELLERAPFKGRIPAFIGDDLTDESGFAFVNAVGGMSLRVGMATMSTHAQVVLPDPAALRTILLAALQVPDEVSPS